MPSNVYSIDKSCGFAIISLGVLRPKAISPSCGWALLDKGELSAMVSCDISRSFGCAEIDNGFKNENDDPVAITIPCKHFGDV